MAQAPKYVPNPVPANTEDLPRYIFEEFIKLQGALQENPTTFIEVKNVAPSRVKQGDIAYADGTNWNPGQGEGLYLYDGTNWIAFSRGLSSAKGVFYSTQDHTTTQTNTAQIVTFNNTDHVLNTSIVSNSRITVVYGGYYKIDFSAELRTQSNKGDFWIWLRKNGTNVAHTARKVNVESSDMFIVPAWSYNIQLAANDYIELVWATDETDLYFKYSSSTAFAPEAPSVIISIIQVSQ